MHLRDYLKKNNILIVDGAMGTYYAMKTAQDTTLAEKKANLHNPHIIQEIHEEYIAAGAKLIRTNTYSANTANLNCDEKMVMDVIRKGYKIAKRCTKGQQVFFIGASIGPIPEKKEREMEEIVDEYKKIVDTFLELGNQIFVFETFSSIKYIKVLADYIMLKNEEAEILAQFSVNAFGYSKEGISARRLIDNARQVPGLVAYGFNCGIGVGHLYKVIKTLALEDENIIAIPNAGYPDKIFERTVYRNNAKYFAESMMDIRQLGMKVLGGCCGTTPKHIETFVNCLDGDYNPVSVKRQMHKTKTKHVAKKKNNQFFEKN